MYSVAYPEPTRRLDNCGSVIVVGNGSSKPIMNGDGTINKEASRRTDVSFKMLEN